MALSKSTSLTREQYPSKAAGERRNKTSEFAAVVEGADDRGLPIGELLEVRWTQYACAHRASPCKFLFRTDVIHQPCLAVNQSFHYLYFACSRPKRGSGVRKCEN